MGSLIAISGWRSPFAAPIADALIRQGNSVLALLHDEAVPSNTDRSVSFIKLLVNSGDTASVKRELDGLVLCDTEFQLQVSTEFDEEPWMHHLDGILFPRLRALRYAKPLLRKGSSIVFITTSEIARGTYGALAYSGTNGAIHEYMKGCANLLGRQSAIRCNAVAPGWIEGVLTGEQAVAAAIDGTPLGRLGQLSEVASVVCFLLGSGSSFINGQIIPVDGGYASSDPLARAEYESAGGSTEAKPG